MRIVVAATTRIISSNFVRNLTGWTLPPPPLAREKEAQPGNSKGSSEAPPLQIEARKVFAEPVCVIR